MLQTRSPEIRTFTMTDEDGEHVFGHCCVVYQEAEAGTATAGYFEPCCLCVLTKRKYPCSLRLFLECYLECAKEVWAEQPEQGKRSFQWTEGDLRVVYSLLEALDPDDTMGRSSRLVLSKEIVSSRFDSAASAPATNGSSTAVSTGSSFATVNFNPPSESPEKSLPLSDAVPAPML